MLALTSCPGCLLRAATPFVNTALYPLCACLRMQQSSCFPHAALIHLLKLARHCRAAAEQFPVRPKDFPQLFDKPQFFNKVAEKSLLKEDNIDLLFFAFYFQPVCPYTEHD